MTDEEQSPQEATGESETPTQPLYRDKRTARFAGVPDFLAPARPARVEPTQGPLAGERHRTRHPANADGKHFTFRGGRRNRTGAFFRNYQTSGHTRSHGASRVESGGN